MITPAAYWKEFSVLTWDFRKDEMKRRANKNKTRRQDRRFGETWIWWLRLSPDYNVEEIQANTADRPEQERKLRITAAESLRSSPRLTCAHAGLLSLAVRNQIGQSPPPKKLLSE
ncbi:hypothetical protein EYF80_058753 [Liparis tanakae]|uniref:Uncharacterized protein n=1 Tax=Liparis tanakae TaxID=230148 RepID=A0A4Z2EQK4_9TELE|nr:hypothetical protein EYF80_058753 [Liparis tanakae]